MNFCLKKEISFLFDKQTNVLQANVTIVLTCT